MKSCLEMRFISPKLLKFLVCRNLQWQALQLLDRQSKLFQRPGAKDLQLCSAEWNLQFMPLPKCFCEYRGFCKRMQAPALLNMPQDSMLAISRTFIITMDLKEYIIRPIFVQMEMKQNCSQYDNVSNVFFTTLSYSVEYYITLVTTPSFYIATRHVMKT